MEQALTVMKQLARRAKAGIGSLFYAGRRNPELPGALSIRRAVELEFGIHATGIRAIHSRENGVWRLDSAQGYWVAKTFPTDTSFERVHREIQLYRWLSSRDIRVPTYMSRLQGGEVAKLEQNGRKTLLVLMRYEQLSQLRPGTCNKYSVDSIGRELAAAHAKLQNYPDAGELTPELYDLDHPEPVHEAQGAFHALQASQLASSFKHSQLSKFKTVDSQVEQHLDQNKLPANLTRSVIHGDLYLANILLHPNDRALLLDWEAIQAPITVDLAVLSTDLYLAEDISFARWKTLRQWLLAAYASHMPLAEQDLRSIPTLTLLTLMDLIRIYCEPSADFTRKAHVITRCYELAEFLLREEQCVEQNA